MNVNAIYVDLRNAAEKYGWVGDHADDLLMMAAEAIADDPQNQS